MFESLKKKADAWLQGRMDSATDEYIQKYAIDGNGKADPKLVREIKVESERSKVITQSLYWDEPIMWAGVSATLGFLSGVFQRIVGNGNGNNSKSKEDAGKKPERSHLATALQGAALASLSAAAISLIRIPQRADKSFRSRIESKMEAQKLEALLTEQQTNQVSP